MLSIKNLQVSINGKVILKDFNLEVKEGEVHAIMGPNGSGKSTLASVIAGRDLFTVDHGEIIYRGQNLLEMAPETRAREGIFLGFQYPVEIPGVSMANFMRSAMNEKRKYLGMEPLTGAEFLKIMEEKKKFVDIQSKLTNRSVNEGFSGGEKKKNEIFQMALLEPRLAILDETDSGLDIDALKVVANGVNKLRRKDNATVVITHYQRLLDFIIPDQVHVLFDGRIVKSGPKELAMELETKGYEWIKKEEGTNSPS
jgi:Fe-S cluster assembly ATP-binding protein